MWLLGVRPDPVGCALLAGARLDRPSAQDACQEPEDAGAPVVVRSSRSLAVLAAGGPHRPHWVKRYAWCTFGRVTLRMKGGRTASGQLVYSQKLYFIWLSRAKQGES